MHLAALLAAKRRKGCASDRQVGGSVMTDKEIIEMAEKAGLVDWSNSLQRYWIDAHEPGNELIEFARAVAQHARQATQKRACQILHNQLREARFDDRFHLGLGDVRYTCGMENEFELELIEFCETLDDK
jgi:hypothetical protein